MQAVAEEVGPASLTVSCPKVEACAAQFRLECALKAPGSGFKGPEGFPIGDEPRNTVRSNT